MRASQIALSIACPVCSSAISLGCRDSKGRPVSAHVERLKHAEALGVGKPKRRRERSTSGTRKPRRPIAPVKVIRADGLTAIVSQRSIRSRRTKP